MEAGLDSLGAVELCNAIAARFSIAIPATVTFDYPTIRALAQYLVSRGSLPAVQAIPAPVHAAPQGLGYAHVLAAILTARADVLQAPISPDEPFMEVVSSMPLLLMHAAFMNCLVISKVTRWQYAYRRSCLGAIARSSYHHQDWPVTWHYLTLYSVRLKVPNSFHLFPHHQSIASAILHRPV